MAPAVATYEPRDPSSTMLYKVIADHLETFLASFEADPDAKGLPTYVQREFYDYVPCGILAHGFLRLGCDTCHTELLLPLRCKRRGCCPSWAGRRMAQTAAHLVARVIPWVSTRPWVVSVPMPLRYWMAASQSLTAQVHTILRTTIGQYDVNQAVTRGSERQKVQSGAVTCIQRFGSAINVHVHYHVVFLEGVSLDRTDQDRQPRLVKGEPPPDADSADVVQTISRRVLRKLRHLGYLEAGIDAAVATGSDPLVDDAPEFAHPLAASVQQRIACGERAGQTVRRIGSGFGTAFFPLPLAPSRLGEGGIKKPTPERRPAPRGTPVSPTLLPPALPVQAVLGASPPGAGALRRGGRTALGAREAPRARGGRWRGVLPRGRRQKAV